MQIPVFKKAADANSVAADSSVLKPLPPLAAVSINSSRFRVLFYRYSYGVFALGLLLVFYPFIIQQPLWLAGLVLSWSGLWLGHRLGDKQCLSGTLSFSGKHWWLERDGCICQLELSGAVLCWPWLIILPFSAVDGRKAQRLLLFGDSLNEADNARLRRWLRACLTPKA